MEVDTKGSIDDHEIICIDQQDDDNRTPLEDFVRLSESHLWKLMSNFYESKGVESWSRGIVPHFITSNAFIGRTYARLLKAFLLDLKQQPQQQPSIIAQNMKLFHDEKLYIVEIGAGSGKFAFFMLKALQELEMTIDFPVNQIVYVLSDFTESNESYWRDHPALRPYIESGRLDFGIFNAGVDEEIFLKCSGVTLSKSHPAANPICLISNYVFDTLVQDLFQVHSGMIHDGLISVGSDRPDEPDPQDPEIISRLFNKYLYRPSDTNFYTTAKGTDQNDQIHMSRMLSWYKEYFTENDPLELGASVLVPIGALRAIRHISDISNGTIIISGDKGSTNPEQFRGLVDPHIAVHGSFSVMVNYHAIGIYTTSRGGFALHTPQEETSLQVSCFVLPPENNNNNNNNNGTADNNDDGQNDPLLFGDNLSKIDMERSKQFPILQQTYNDTVESFGPNDFFMLQKSLKEEAAPKVGSILALLKLSAWDPDVFFKFRDVLLNQISTASIKLRNDLSRGIPLVWQNYYALDKEKDVAFEIGRFYYGIRKFLDALIYYEISSNTIGPHHVTFHNMGLCHYSLGNLNEASSFFQRSLDLDPSYLKASNWLEKVAKEIHEEKPGGD